MKLGKFSIVVKAGAIFYLPFSTLDFFLRGHSCHSLLLKVYCLANIRNNLKGNIYEQGG